MTLNFSRLCLAVLVSGAAVGCVKNTGSAELDLMRAELDACRSSLAAADSAAVSASDLAAKRLKAYRELADKLRAALGVEDLDIIIRNGRMVVQLPNKILFDTGKTDLKPEGQEILTRLAGVIKTVDRSFLIGGHTDNVPVKVDAARFKDNWELSALRATTAVTFLQGQGVPPTHLGAGGYGEYLPDDTNDTEAGRAENRRLEVIVLPRLDEIPEFPSEL